MHLGHTYGELCELAAMGWSADRRAVAPGEPSRFHDEAFSSFGRREWADKRAAMPIHIGAVLRQFLLANVRPTEKSEIQECC